VVFRGETHHGRQGRRFRADSDPMEDMLISCIRFNCHGVRDRASKECQEAAERGFTGHVTERMAQRERELAEVVSGTVLRPLQGNRSQLGSVWLG